MAEKDMKENTDLPLKTTADIDINTDENRTAPPT